MGGFWGYLGESFEKTPEFPEAAATGAGRQSG